MAGFLLSSIALSVSVLLMAALAACFPGAVSPRLRYFAWCVILLGFLLPVVPRLGAGAPAINVPREAVDALSAINAGAVSAMEAAAPAFPSTANLLAPAWLATAALLFGYRMSVHRRFMRCVARWGEEVRDERALAAFAKAKEEAGVRNARLLKCAFVSSPMLAGLLRPAVLLPARDFAPHELALIFRHELVHLRRGDLLVKLLSVAAVSLHWFNPAVYLLDAKIRADCEASCDEAVVGKAGQFRMPYAKLILAMLGPRPRLATPLATGLFSGKRSVKRRISEIIEPRRRGHAGLLAVPCALAIVAASGSVFSLPAAPSGNFEAFETFAGRAEIGAGIEIGRAPELGDGHAGPAIDKQRETLPPSQEPPARPVQARGGRQARRGACLPDRNC